MSAIHRISTQAERGRLAMICAKVLDNSSVLSLQGHETKAYGYKALQQTLLIIHPRPLRASIAFLSIVWHTREPF